MDYKNNKIRVVAPPQSVIFQLLRKKGQFTLLPQRGMLRVKTTNYGLHYGPPHEVRLASYPEPLAVDAECLRLPLIKPQSKRRGPLYLLLSDRSASQSRYEFYTKVAFMIILYAGEYFDLLTIKKQDDSNVLSCFVLAY